MAAKRMALGRGRMLAILLVALLAIAPGAAAEPRIAATEDVAIVDFAFAPQIIVIADDSTIAWENIGTFPHTVTADDGSFNSGNLDPGQTFEWTFEEPVTLTYRCIYHDVMRGTIVVLDDPIFVPIAMRPQ